MERDGRLITLPLPKNGNGNGRIARHVQPPQPVADLRTSLQALEPVELVVVSTKASSRRWRELVTSCHYFGYIPFAGAQLRYLIENRSGTLGVLSFAASAWTRTPRDGHIGWDRATRETARLHLVVGNARFFILPRVRVRNLASHPRPDRPRSSRRLARRLRLCARALGDLRRDQPVQWDELSGGDLDLGRTDHRARQARPDPRARAPRQGRVPLLPARLPQHPHLASVTSAPLPEPR